VDVDAGTRAIALHAAGGATAQDMILLDTNALIWLAQGHRRIRPLLSGSRRLYASPASLLELQLLIEGGRVRLRAASLDALANNGRWVVDDPPSASWFKQAWDLSWTRDPFDRLLVAHAGLRGWRLATADTHLLDHLGSSETVPL
jgi:PIN domain nuclease of toxin-antitoxin system